MSFLISNAQSVIGEDMEPPPELDKIFLTNSRLEDIRFNLFPSSHSFQNKKGKYEKEEDR